VDGEDAHGVADVVGLAVGLSRIGVAQALELLDEIVEGAAGARFARSMARIRRRSIET
jgi:hypothetical protein